MDTILQERRTLIALGVVAAVLFAITNLPWQLDDYDQAQQAFTSYEMINQGHWFYQRTPHELIAQKPPLIGWASAAIFAVTRSWDIAWRLPSFIASAAIAVTLFRAAAAAYGLAPAFVALSAFCLNLMTVRLATLVRTDMPLALTIFLAGLLVFQKVRSAAPWRTRERWLFCALLTVSMWIKGPFIHVFLLPAIILFQWRWRGSKNANAWCGWWPWILSLVLFLPWVIGGLRTFPTFYEQVIAFEVLARFGTAIHHGQPVYFYLLHILHKFAPWSILMITVAVIGVGKGSASFRQAIVQISPETFWLVLWSLAGFVIMSFIPSKRVDRVYSIVPPLCLLLAAQMGNGLRSHQVRRGTMRAAIASILIAVVFTTGYTAWKIGFGYYDHTDALVKFGWAVKTEAKRHHWRYEVISGTAGSEGMLLYLEKLHFVDTEEAAREWNAGELDAIAVPKADSENLLAQLTDAAVSPLRSVHRTSQPKVDYELIVRPVWIPAGNP